MTSSVGSSARLPLGIVRQIDTLCDAYEADLEASQTSDLEPYLSQVDESHRSAALKALIGVELDYWESRGAVDPRAEVLRRHASLESQILATSHFAVGQLSDVTSSADARAASSRQGLSLRCPHCRERFEVVSQAPLGEVVCSRCGSTIDLLGTETADSTVASGETIAHFKLVERLGVGSFGTVWRARDNELDREVALKIPRKGRLEPEERRLFLREARSAAQLNHPHIVSVHEVGFEDDLLFIVSDLVHGQTLSEHLKTDLPDQRRAAELCATIAGALAHAHEQGVIHRDLKPQNIMLDSGGAAYIMDFGLAKRTTADATMTLEGRLVGTPAYMSPEQAKSDALPADPRSDVYSLGVVLFQLLTGQLPFRGSTPAILQQVVHVEAPDPRSLDPRIDRDLAAICRRCLEKDRASRYQTAGALQDDLNRYLRSEPVDARRLTPRQRIWRWYARRRRQFDLRVAAAGVLIAVLVGLGSLLWVRQLNRLARDADARAETQAADLASLVYANEMNDAYAVYEKGWTEEARQMLDAIRERESAQRPPDLAWRLLNQLTRPPDAHLIGMHPGGANEIVVFPDGQRLASVGGDGLVRIWDIEQGQLLRSLDFGAALPEIDLATGGMHSIALSPDGRYLAAGADVVGIVDLEQQGKIGDLFHADYNVETLCFSADGQRIGAFVRYEEVVLLSLDGAVLARFPSYTRGNSLEYLREEQAWLVPHAKQPKAFSELRVVSDDFSQELEISGMNSTAIVQPKVARVDPTRQRLAVSSAEGRFVTVVDRTSATPHLLTPEYRETISDHAWSPDGRMLAIAYLNGVLRCHRFGVLEDGEPALSVDAVTFAAHERNLNCIRFVDQERVATCGKDGAIKLWKPFERSGRVPLPADSPTPLVAKFSPGGKQLATVSTQNNLLAIYDVREGRLVAQTEVSRPREVHWMPTGDGVLVCPFRSDELFVFDATLKRRQRIKNPHLIHGAASAPAGDQFATIDQDEIILYSGQTLQAVDRRPLEETGRVLAFSPDGSRLAYGGAKPVLGICQTSNLSDAFVLESPANVQSLTWSGDGSVMASGHANGAIRLWDPDQGTLLQELVGHPSRVEKVFLSHTGETLISVCHDDGTRVWQTDQGRCLGRLATWVHELSTANQKAIIGYASDATPQFPTNYIETLRP